MIPIDALDAWMQSQELSNLRERNRQTTIDLKIILTINFRRSIISPVEPYVMRQLYATGYGQVCKLRALLNPINCGE